MVLFHTDAAPYLMLHAAPMLRMLVQHHKRVQHQTYATVTYATMQPKGAKDGSFRNPT